ncbi:PhzF family phenazine biosynthesis protein [Flavobacterium sp. XS1P32]|uniref:PhzF family phenazine biosynthesis protein n=1 Tax=Flavobacterium sp. XS1P32 TaxID=3401726 RepID=UPI003AAFD0D8
MNLPFYIVDVFTENKYAGNQLAVFLDAHSLSTEQMQLIAREINFAESTFIAKLDGQKCAATIRIFTPEHEMQFAGHPIIGTSWVLMNKIFENKPDKITISVPVGEIPVRQVGDLVWLQAAQPQFLDTFSKEDFTTFSNLSSTDFEDAFPIQEVTTGSAFVIVPLKNIKALERLIIDKDKMNNWMQANCKTSHRALYFYCLEDAKLSSRMLCVENNQLIEDAATGSASTCLQAFLLKYHALDIQITNHQGEYINRPSQIYFDGKLTNNDFDINIGGKSQFIAKGEWEV